MDVAKEMRALLDDAVEETRVSLGESKDAVAAFMAQRAEHLSVITAEPGFGLAVIAERDSVALFAGLRASEQADAMDQRFLGMIAGALRIAALAIA